MLQSSDRDWAPVVDFFAARGIEVGLLVPTETALNKSILDATEIVRAAFTGSGFHDYSTQPQGPDNKRLVDAVFVQVDKNDITKASLYRPQTKDGDPRIWFYGLTEYAIAGNLLAIVPDGDRLVVINCSNPYLWQQIESGKGQAADLVSRLTSELSEIERELLQKLQDISSAGWHNSVTPGAPGVGMTLESLLEIAPNSSGAPDYKGIELKAKRRARGKAKTGLQTIFSKTPDWNLSPICSAINLLNEHGYDTEDRRQLYCTVSASKATNRMGFWLEAEPERSNLWCVREIDDARSRLMYWDIDTLRQSLRKKHRTTMWVAAESRKSREVEQFHYHAAELTRAPLESQFGIRLDDGTVTLDLTLSERPGGNTRDHGYLFRCKSENLSRLFPNPILFDLAKDYLAAENFTAG